MTSKPVFAPAPRLTHERYCDEILTQTRLLAAALDGADLSARVPTCPDWSLRELVIHLGGAQRWVTRMVRTESPVELPEEDTPGYHGPSDDSPVSLVAWLTEGGEQLAEALREAGPTTAMWTWTPQQDSGFWARRMAHEGVIHRADAYTAMPGTAYELAPDVAADCLDEWLDVVVFAASQADEDLQALRPRAGATLHLHATDGPEALEGDEAEWLIEITEDGPVWRRGHEKATVALRGPVTDVLRVFYRRLPLETDTVEVLGDAELLRFWLDRASWS